MSYAITRPMSHNSFDDTARELQAVLERMSSSVAAETPDGKTWGDVGSLKHVLELVQQASDFYFQEGEHAS